LADSVALYHAPGTGTAPPGPSSLGLDIDAAATADLLLDFRYDLDADVVRRFRRSAMLDIDPGDLQTCMTKGEIDLAHHDVYFTIGETVGKPGARFPDAGRSWHYIPPCVALGWWPPRWAAVDAPFTTVAHWYDERWLEGDDGRLYDDSKRAAFLPFVDLPSRTRHALELAVDLVPNDEDHVRLWQGGWFVRESYAVASTPWDYQRYIQGSRGEFSCAKPHCIRLQNAWISDRTLCYLASGKPAVVQHTGPSAFLPEREGLFRFHDLDDAIRCLDAVANDYERQCRLARALAEEHFDGRKVAERLLAIALA
jgi:hypothetical protein